MLYTKVMQRARGHGRLHNRRQAFSLIELSIVVTIFSIVSVLGLEVATSFLNSSAYDSTKIKLSVLDAATQKFYWVYGRLPCPAKRLNPGNPSDYGMEDCTNTVNASDSSIMNGAVPFRTLNLQPDDAIDSYSTKINYVVSTNLASSVALFNSNAGNIQIRTGRLEAGSTCTTYCTSLTTEGAYVYFSNGADKRGAVSKRDINLTACAISGDSRIDAQNCFNTATPGGSLSVGAIPANVFYDTRFNPGSQLTNYFDDAIVWRKKDQL